MCYAYLRRNLWPKVNCPNYNGWFGLKEVKEGNAVYQANTPNFDRYWEEYPHE